MRFEILETVHTPDREKVLRVLEMCSREVSTKVVRYGDRITLQGFGPSPRAKNVRDTTVFRVNAEDDQTIISGEVSFQASALLGDQPQGEVVRSKLEELFNQMKMQIGLSTETAQDGELEIRNEIPAHELAHEPADAVSVGESGLVAGAEPTAELERIVLPVQNVGESSVELEGNAWLDELFIQMKAQFEIEEGQATAAAATVPTTEAIASSTVVADSVVANDISERESVAPAAPGRVPEIVDTSLESELAESEPADGSKGSAEPEGSFLAEQASQDLGTEQRLEPLPHVDPDQGFDLKDNAWLEELFNKMNAQIDLDASPATEDAAVAASIDPALPNTPDEAASVLTEDVSAKEATSTDAPDREPEVMNATAESSLDGEAPITESGSAGLKQNAEEGRTADLVQNAGVDSSVELQLNPETEQSAKPAQSIEEQLTAILEESAKTEEAVKEQPSIDPGQSVWLQHVIELDQHAPKRIELPQFLVAGDVEEAPPKRRLAKWITGLVVLLLVAAGMLFLYRTRFSLNPAVPSVQTIEQPAPATMDSLPATEPAPVADTKPSLPTTRAQIADPAVQVADIRGWLDNWATAMRTRDASAQAAFYADTVDEYVGKYDVSKDAVLKDREATIHMRKGLWTVKMEKVVIERQTKSEAEVRLVKHFIDEPAPSEIVESFVPTHLKLKRVAGGGWRITSEQDLPSSSAPQSR